MTIPHQACTLRTFKRSKAGLDLLHTQWLLTKNLQWLPLLLHGETHISSHENEALEVAAACCLAPSSPRRQALLQRAPAFVAGPLDLHILCSLSLQLFLPQRS